MSDRELFEELESQQDHVNDLAIALRESQGRLDSLREQARERLQSEYRGTSVTGKLRTFFLDHEGEVASLEIATPGAGRQEFSESEIDRIMSADWQPLAVCGPFDLRGFSGPVYVGFRGDNGKIVIRNGEVS